MTDVCAQTAFLCNRHAGCFQADCLNCTAAQTLNALPSLPGLRDSLNILESRIADQDSEIGALRRRVTELEHARIASQATHNALVETMERQEQHLRDLSDKLQEVAVELRQRIREIDEPIAYLLDRERVLTARLNHANIGYA